MIVFPSFSDAPKEQSVFIMLNGEESELCFMNLANPKVREATSFYTSSFHSAGKSSAVWRISYTCVGSRNIKTCL
jgi:hypothetical protein